MAHTINCPRCKKPLEIPQPIPEQVRCASCGATMKYKAKPGDSRDGTTSARPTPTPAEPKVSPRGMIVGVAILGGGLLLAVLSCAGLGLAWSLSAGKAKDDKNAQAKSAAKPVEEDNWQPPQSYLKATAPRKEPLPPKIAAAVNKGSTFLKQRILAQSAALAKDDRFITDQSVGAIALSGLALLEADVPVTDKAIWKALKMIRDTGPRLRNVYAQGAAVFFLNRLHDIEPLERGDRDLLRTLALRMIAGQLPDGCWTYHNPPISAEEQEQLLLDLRNNTYKPHGTALNNYPSHSMTQFALLSLWNSARHDIPVRPAILASAAHFQVMQYPDGTWGYSTKQEKTYYFDSNTCAGLIALAMDKTLRDDKEFRHSTVVDAPSNPMIDAQVVKGFAHLTKVIGRTKNESNPMRAENGDVLRVDAWGDYYFLWCLERVAVIYDKKEIGGKDWYAWGSEVILNQQRGDGSWDDRHGEVPDTCFAILFLTRCNLAKDLTRSIRMRDGRPIGP